MSGLLTYDWRLERERKDFKDWHENNALVVSWIKLTIDPELSSSISHHEVHSLWTHMQMQFAMKSGKHVQQIKTDLANCRQKGQEIFLHIMEN